MDTFSLMPKAESKGVRQCIVLVSIQLGEMGGVPHRYEQIPLGGRSAMRNLGRHWMLQISIVSIYKAHEQGPGAQSQE